MHSGFCNMCESLQAYGKRKLYCEDHFRTRAGALCSEVIGQIVGNLS